MGPRHRLTEAGRRDGGDARVTRGGLRRAGQPASSGRGGVATPARCRGRGLARGHARGGGRCHEDAYDGLRHLPFAESRLAGNGGGGGRCRDRHSSRVAPPSPAGTVRWRPGRARGGRHLDGRRDGRRRGRCRRTRHRRGCHGRRQHLGRDAGCIRASDRWRCRGRARLAMPGRRGLDRLCLPRWWRHVGADRRDAPGRCAPHRGRCAPLPRAWVRGSRPRSSRRSSPAGRLTDHAARHAHHGPDSHALGRFRLRLVEAIGIRDGRIAFAGSEVYLETRDPFTERIRLEPDRVAIPGLTVPIST